MSRLCLVSIIAADWSRPTHRLLIILEVVKLTTNTSYKKTLFTFSCSHSCRWQMVANQQSFITVTEPMPVSALCRSWVKNMFWRFVFKRQRLLVLVKTVIKFCKRACNSGTPWMPCNESIITAHMICVRRPSSSRIPLWVFLIISCLYERHVTIKVVAHLYCLQNAFHCTHALQKNDP